jgi:hypothetical protein
VRAASRAKCSGDLSVRLQRSPTTRPPPPLVPRAVFTPSFRDDEDVEPRQRLRVAGKGSIGGRDQDAAQFIVEASANLRDARVVRARGLVGPLDQLQLRGDLGIAGSSRNG